VVQQRCADLTSMSRMSSARTPARITSSRSCTLVGSPLSYVIENWAQPKLPSRGGRCPFRSAWAVHMIQVPVPSSKSLRSIAEGYRQHPFPMGMCRSSTKAGLAVNRSTRRFSPRAAGEPMAVRRSTPIHRVPPQLAYPHPYNAVIGSFAEHCSAVEPDLSPSHYLGIPQRP
jgi:hypothetical protein